MIWILQFAMKRKTFAILGVLIGGGLGIAVEYRSRGRSSTGSHVELKRWKHGKKNPSMMLGWYINDKDTYNFSSSWRFSKVFLSKSSKAVATPNTLRPSWWYFICKSIACGIPCVKQPGQLTWNTSTRTTFPLSLSMLVGFPCIHSETARLGALSPICGGNTLHIISATSNLNA